MKTKLLTLFVLFIATCGTFAQTIPDNEIWYTSSNGKVVEPHSSNVFGATILSNTYTNGKGVIKFYSNVTTIGKDAFRFCTNLTSITIPNSVITIGDYAFDSCERLKSATIGNSVTTIGNSAFNWCLGLTTVIIPNSVTSIGKDAFHSCNLTSITIPNSVTTIGEYAFCDCSGLTSVVIPNSVTTIGEYAFYNCSGMTSVVIGHSVTTIGERVFNGCINLMSVTLYSNEITNKTFTFRSNLGYMFGSQVKTYIFDDLVTNIGDYAFADCRDLTSVIVGNSVRTIGDYAFYKCTSLTSVSLGNSVTTIGWCAFYECSGLTSVTIGHSVTTIGGEAFYGCSSLKKTNYTGTIADWCKIKLSNSTSNPIYFSKNFYINDVEVKDDLVIPEGVEAIGDYAFRECEGLTSVTIGKSVTTIGDYAFYGCDSLKTVYNNSNLNVVKKSKDYGYVAYYANNVYNGIPKGDFVIKDDTIVTGYIGNATDIVIPNGITQIGTSAFSGCSKLTSVTIPNSVTTIGITAFGHCFDLTSIIIPNSVTTIEENAFFNCRGLTSVTIGNSVTTIGESAFAFCYGLTSVIIGSSVTTIGYRAFEDCSGLKKTNYTGTIADWCKIKFGNSDANPMSYSHNFYINDVEIKDLVIPEGIDTIGEYAFYECSGLTSVTIGNSVTTIGEDAFYGCAGLTSINVDAGNTHYTSFDGVLFNYAKDTLILYPIGNSRTEYIVPNSVTTIGSVAFAWCEGLTSVTIPNSVTMIRYDAFDNCSGLTSVTINSNAICSKTYTSSSNIGTLFGSQVKEYIINNSVTTIGINAFLSCKGLTSVTIGSSVTKIEGAAFYGCDSLKTVYNFSNLNITKGSKEHGYVAYYADNVYNGIPKGDFVIKDDTIVTGYIGNATDIVIPNGITQIGKKAFYNCTGLTSVTIPNSVTTIGEDAFYNCSGLKKTNYMGTIADWCKIDFHATYDYEKRKSDYASNPISYSHNFFINDVEVKDLVIPEGVDAIGRGAFCDCYGLTSITISNSVTTIGSYAFSSCGRRLTSLTIGNSVTSIGERAFWVCLGLDLVTIPSLVRYIGELAFMGSCSSVNITDLTAWCKMSLPMYCEGNPLTCYSPFGLSYKLYLNNQEITDLVIPNGIDVLKSGAFNGVSNHITSLTIPNSVTSIESMAFSNFFWIEKITCYAVSPSTCSTDCVEHIDESIPVYVPAESINKYRTAQVWKEFTNILPIGAEKITTEEPTLAEPTAQGVTISWQKVSGTDSYQLVIMKGTLVVSTFVFDADGILISSTYNAPTRNRQDDRKNASTTADGFRFQVTGLEQDTEYTYTITAKNTSAQPIKTYSGKFTTTGTTGLENLTIDKNVGNKFSYGNHLYIRRGDNLYNATGARVK